MEAAKAREASFEKGDAGHLAAAALAAFVATRTAPQAVTT